MLSRKRSTHVQRKLAGRKSHAKVEQHVEEQFLTGRLLGVCHLECTSLSDLSSCSLCGFAAWPVWEM